MGYGSVECSVILAFDQTSKNPYSSLKVKLDISASPSKYICWLSFLMHAIGIKYPQKQLLQKYVSVFVSEIANLLS